MSVAGTKTEVSASNFEIDSDEHQLGPTIRAYHLLDSARLGLTALALAAGVTILGVAANSISVYNSTNLPDDYLLSLWPSNMDFRPTVALVVSSVVVIVANVVSLVVSKVSAVRSRPGVNMSVWFMAPLVAFVAALIAMVFFYVVNASSTHDSFQSWTCRWKDVAMMTKPYFGTLCKQSKAGLGLAVFLVPLEAIIIGVAGYQTVLQKQLNHATQAPERKTGGPSMS